VAIFFCLLSISTNVVNLQERMKRLVATFALKYVIVECKRGVQESALQRHVEPAEHEAG
jgi:hypothetical protein